MNIEGATLSLGSRSAALCGCGPGAAAWTSAEAGAETASCEHAERCAAGVAGRARRGVHRVLGRGRSGRCRLVGILETGAAAEPAAAAARYEAVVRALPLVLLVLLTAAPAFAQESGEPAAPRSWQSLSPQQQQLLHGFQGNWDSLPAEKQQSLARGSDRWIHMTPEERTGAQDRFKQWRALPPEQRQQLRERWRQFKSLPAEQQQRGGEQSRRFRQIPPEQRQALRRQWQQMTPEQRRGALQRAPGGPRAGAVRPAPRPGPGPRPRRFPR